MRAIVGICFVLLAAGQACTPQDRPAQRGQSVASNGPARQTTASVVQYDSAGQRYIKTTSHRYFVVQSYQHNGQPQRLLVHEEVERHCCVQAEREQWGTIALEAWPDSAPAGSAPLWRTRVTADEGKLGEDFYRAALHGCCGASDELLFVSLRYGGPVYVSSRTRSADNGPVLPSLNVPNSSLRRFIAFHDRNTEDNPPEARADSLVVGVLQYGPEQAASERVVVRRVPPDSGYYVLTDLGFLAPGKQGIQTRADLWSADQSEDPSRLSGFALRVHLMCQCERPELDIDISVVHDSLDLAHARVPSFLSLAFSKVK